MKALELINNQELVGAQEDTEGNKIEMGSIRSQNVVMPTKSAHTEITDYSRVYCYMHQERQIEYFCRNCHQLVCPKCMFKDHNGHEFAQLDDVTNVVKQNISDLQKLLENTKRINEDNRTYIDN